MYFFTHLFISKTLYRHFAGEMELDKQAFAFGNIKPDLPSSKRNHHTLENCLDIVCEKANRLMEEEVSIRDFSVSLGEICHYVCDFFCYYHLNETLHEQKLHHFLYELRLHIKLHTLCFGRKFKLKPSNQIPRKDILFIISEMRKLYHSQPMSMRADIEYAFLAAVWTCESIISHVRYSSDVAKEAELALQALFLTEGGSI